MKASDFNFRKEIKFSFETGEVFFRDNRLVIFDANAFGLLRQSIIDKLGFYEARKLMLRVGFINGYSDFIQIKTKYGKEFDSGLELMLAGPVLHRWEGFAKVTPIDYNFDKQKGILYSHGYWENSLEAQQHLTFNDIADEPVCWTLEGYAAGWSTVGFGSKVIAIEHKCVGKGDEICEWEVKPVKEWDQKIIKPYLEAFKNL